MARRVIVAMMLLGTIAGAGQSTPSNRSAAKASPQGTHLVLVELFTSEGCSSCPPADDLLRQVAGTRTEHGTWIVGLSEHVTYWDHDGWTDPFGSEALTGRQSEYGQRFHLDSVYTPQMVVNGETQFVGSNRAELADAITKAETEEMSALTITSVNVTGKQLEAQISVAGAAPAHPLDMFAALAEDETTEHVLRGENRGRTLSHAAVARVFERVGTVSEAGERNVQLKLPAGLANSQGKRRHIVVWLQERDEGRVMGVASKDF